MDLAVAVAAIKAGLEGVGPAHAVEAADPLRAGGVARGDAQPRGRRDQPLEARGEAADIVGDGAERLVRAARAETTEAPAPGAPLPRLRGVACDPAALAP